MYRNEPIEAIRGAKVRLFIETAIIPPPKKLSKVAKKLTFKFI